jgi:hypothetical protein
MRDCSADDPEMGSGHSEPDKAAPDAIKSSIPFQPLPEQFHGPYRKLRSICL